MCDVSCESGNQNIFFITWRIITILFDSLLGRLIIFYSMSMMSFLVYLPLVRSIFVSRIIACKVSSFITCKANVLRQIFVRFSSVFLPVRVLTFVMVCSTFIGLYCESLIFTSYFLFLFFPFGDFCYFWRNFGYFWRKKGVFGPFGSILGLLEVLWPFGGILGLLEAFSGIFREIW